MGSGDVCVFVGYLRLPLVCRVTSLTVLSPFDSSYMVPRIGSVPTLLFGVPIFSTNSDL